jgi:hypothetical protein
MNEALEQYKVEPHPWWQTALYSGLDAYETMEQANRRGWHEVSAWGSRGWDLGSWPLVIVYFRNAKAQGTIFYQLAEYVEGDVTVYSCTSPELREQICNAIAFFHWKMQEQDWIRGIETFEELPSECKGPYKPTSQ